MFYWSIQGLCNRHMQSGYATHYTYNTPAENCQVIIDRASVLATAPRPTQAKHSCMPGSSMHQLGRGAAQPQPGIVVQWSGLMQSERLHLSSSRQAFFLDECTRCTGVMRVWVLSEALCRTCDKVLSREPAAQCTRCNHTLCIACRTMIGVFDRRRGKMR